MCATNGGVLEERGMEAFGMCGGSPSGDHVGGGRPARLYPVSVQFCVLTDLSVRAATDLFP